MNKNIHLFSTKEFTKDSEIMAKIGIRGQQAMEFAALNLPILPGFIIDSEIGSHLEKVDLASELVPYFKKVESITGKTFGDSTNPLLVKIVVSPNLAIVHYPTLHNYGLTLPTIPGFNHYVGEAFGYHEILFLVSGNLEIEARIAELEGRTNDQTKIKKRLDELKVLLSKEVKNPDYHKAVAEYRSFFQPEFFDDPMAQLEIALKRISHMLALDELNDNDTSLVVQPMVYGNYGKNSASGTFFTRDIVTGDDLLEGKFFQEKFNEIDAEGKDINLIDKHFLAELQKIARKVEDHYKEIRSIRFTIENGKVWLIDQRPVMTKSTQADIRTLLALNKRKIVSDREMVMAIKPSQLNEILHPIVNLASVKGLKRLDGGISGAPGAAIGRLCFTTDGLLNAHKAAALAGEDTRFILCMAATFAEDVKAIEVATGVLSSEGGYSAHASVVARQYGKVSLVKTDMKFRGKNATIGNVVLKEGDYVTLNVPFYGAPQVYLDKADLIEPDPKESGLLDFIAIVKNYVPDFHVRVNADKPRDAALALKFGAEGIGLCRTEHMFFDEKRINVFREMIISDTVEDRRKALRQLKVMQRKDFYDLLKIMKGKEVTIRLLDAPLHEFLPHNDAEMKAFLKYLRKQNGKERISEAEVQAGCEGLREFNPMLGHRGVRIAVSFPEIYEMQVQAMFEAVYQLKKEGVDVRPEVMIPIVMNESELKLIVYGKKIEGYSVKGLVDVEKEVRASMKARAVPYKIGTMIELPVAALAAGEIARYAEFFSFGTNDLTQTTIGLSRDDFNSFMPDYTRFDIIDGNPFQILDKHVKELIAIAVRRGTLTRPGLVKGLCGEHGAMPENIRFCMDAGLDYVSCSPYSVPLATLAVAQANFEKGKFN